MKHITLLLASLLALGAQAAPPTPAQLGLMQRMAAQCNSVMGKEVCRVVLSAERCIGAPNPDACQYAVFKERYPKGLLVAGWGRFTADEFFIYAKEDDRMCDVIVRECSIDWNGRPCKMAQALWSWR